MISQSLETELVEIRDAVNYAYDPTTGNWEGPILDEWLM